MSITDIVILLAPICIIIGLIAVWIKGRQDDEPGSPVIDETTRIAYDPGSPSGDYTVTRRGAEEWELRQHREAQALDDPPDMVTRLIENDPWEMRRQVHNYVIRESEHDHNFVTNSTLPRTYSMSKGEYAVGNHDLVLDAFPYQAWNSKMFAQDRCTYCHRRLPVDAMECPRCGAPT